MSGAPLGLPEGSVRAVLALLVILTVCAMAFLQRDIPDTLGALAGLVVAAYFSQRANDPPKPPEEPVIRKGPTP